MTAFFVYFKKFGISVGDIKICNKFAVTDMKKFILALMFMGFSLSAVYAQQSGESVSAVSNVSIKKVSISPNPATTTVKVSIEGKQSNLNSISIYSIIGNEVFSKQYNTVSDAVELDVRNLKKGKYLVRVVFGDNSYEVVTLIKQ